MTFKVNKETCIGCGVCEPMCPEVFELAGDKAEVKLDPVPQELIASALGAEEACPVDAISHQQ